MNGEEEEEERIQIQTKTSAYSRILNTCTFMLLLQFGAKNTGQFMWSMKRCDIEIL